MKRLVGGDYLLDLSSIELEESEDGSTKTNITDSDVLEQLTNLKKYISNPEMAKPVWIKLKNGENDELVIARGTFAVVDTGEFEICVQLDGYKLVIFIEFTQVLNSDDEPLDDWYIDTNDAKYLFTSDVQALAGQLADFTGDVEITGDATFNGDIDVDANSKVKIFENIVDKAGNHRFIEGDITPVTALEDVVPFAHWSLSGSHLMLVLCIYNTTESDITISGASGLSTAINLPQWIKDKIYPMGNTPHVLHNFAVEGVKPDDLTQDSNKQATYVIKSSGNLAINGVNFTAKAGYYYRIEFDLLIDDIYA